MRTYDVSPLFRSSVGFDRLFDLLTQAERVEARYSPLSLLVAAVGLVVVALGES